MLSRYAARCSLVIRVMSSSATGGVLYGLLGSAALRIHTPDDDDESNGIGATFSALDECRSHAAHRDLLIEFLLGSILIRLDGLHLHRQNH